MNSKKFTIDILPPFGSKYLTEVSVVRDDLLVGGTKTRFLPGLIHGQREVVFGGPFCGGAPVALAAVCRDMGIKSTIFYAKRAKLHKRQQQTQDLGANLQFVTPGYMTVVQKRARDYAMHVGALFLPLGFHTDLATQLLVEQIQEQFEGNVYDEVWCATGSGMLARSLGLAFPHALVYGVAVGLASRWKNVQLPPNVTIVECPYKYEQECKTPTPFPCCPNYERKAWEAMASRGMGKVLFWNVIGD